MFDCSKFPQRAYFDRVVKSRRGLTPPPPGIEVWPTNALEQEEPPPDLYFYRPGELLVPGEQADLFTMAADAVDGFSYAAGSDNCFVPRGDGHERLEGLRGTWLTGAARFTDVKYKGAFDPEEVIPVLEAAAHRQGYTLHVTPNHVVLGSQNWLIEPCGDPNFPTAEQHLEFRGGGEDIVVAVFDSGLPKGYSANFLMAPVHVDGDQFENFPYEGPMPGGGMLEYAQGHGAFVCGVVRQNARDAEVWSYLVLDNVGTGDEWALGVQLASAIRNQQPRVINLSLGALTRRDQHLLGLTALRRLARKTDGTAPIVVAAAGNLGWARPFYPAYDRWTISVGAAEHSAGIWKQACFSDHGDRKFGFWVDVCAQGVDVYSSYAKQPYNATFPPPGPIAFDGWANWNGTSFSTPHVAGRVARILAAASPARPLRAAVLHELRTQTFRVGSVGWFVP